PRRLPATPAESEAPGAQINKQINKDIKKTAGKPKFFGFVDSLKQLPISRNKRQVVVFILLINKSQSK
ncbi:hypothetical protein J7E77_05470, partial [Bacillus sp. ISL-77]|nr:hypothetical protein [Bacillus sp. ISL-77]